MLRLWFFSFVLLHLSAQTCAESVVNISSGEWAPLISRQMPNGGVVTQIVSESFARENLTPSYSYNLWRDSLALAKEGAADATIGWEYSAGRAKDFFYSDPIWQIEGAYLHLAKNQYQFENMADLHGLTICTVESYYYGADFEKARDAGQVKELMANSPQACLELLLSEKADIFPSQNMAAIWFMRRLLTDEEMASIKISPDFYPPSHIYLLISKRAKNAEQLLLHFNQGLKNLQTSGREAELISAYSQKYLKQ